ncbi:unnamed protein product, partial [Discosporangium mesarthrocarpum]
MALKGYWAGKKKAEEAILRHFPDGAVLLRASAVYGDRKVSSSITIPLGLVMQPAE